MRLARTITLAATITALSALAPPAHAGDIGGGGDGAAVTVTADECTSGGGSVDTSSTPQRCVGGSQDGAEVSG